MIRFECDIEPTDEATLFVDGSYIIVRVKESGTTDNEIYLKKDKAVEFAHAIIGMTKEVDDDTDA